MKKELKGSMSLGNEVSAVCVTPRRPGQYGTGGMDPAVWTSEDGDGEG